MSGTLRCGLAREPGIRDHGVSPAARAVQSGFVLQADDTALGANVEKSRLFGNTGTIGSAAQSSYFHPL
ncbi:MAG: hypothetical protein B7X09_01320 [Acidiphilium sp. 21-66-27]|nr:MAG: hypothetical protein B7X09_01320 [Acidiphilium sp. 21-66-27]